MSNRLKTDFLVPSSSFLTGFGSVLNIAGDYFGYNCSDEPDEAAIASDWKMAGQDLRDIMSPALAPTAAESAHR